MMRIRNVQLIMLFLSALPLLAACGESPDVEKMTAGFVKSGIDAKQAACYAEKAADGLKGETYNYLALLLAEGEPERQAINRARRKYGADFKTPLEEARKACVEEEKEQ